jgi:hypothetical protein
MRTTKYQTGRQKTAEFIGQDHGGILDRMSAKY